MEKIIYDHQIITINNNESQTIPNSLIYKNGNETHCILFSECVKNFQKEYQTAVSNCIGERDFEKDYFLLFSDETKTKIIFKKRFSFKFQHHFLHGPRRQRFWKFQKLLSEINYTTYDLA